MLMCLFRRLRIDKDVAEHEKFDPIYGLPQRSLTAWLSRNPTLADKYNVKLALRARLSRR